MNNQQLIRLRIAVFLCVVFGFLLVAASYFVRKKSPQESPEKPETTNQQQAPKPGPASSSRKTSDTPQPKVSNPELLVNEDGQVVSYSYEETFFVDSSDKAGIKPWMRGKVTLDENSDGASFTFVSNMSTEDDSSYNRSYQLLHPPKDNFIIALGDGTADLFLSDPETNEMTLLTENSFKRIAPWSQTDPKPIGFAFYKEAGGKPLYMTFEKLPEFFRLKK